MKSSANFRHFAENLSTQGYTQVHMAIACLWYANEFNHHSEMSVSDIANLMEEFGLSGIVNMSRLDGALKKSNLTVKGKGKRIFRVSPTKKTILEDKFSSLVKRPKVKVSDDLLPDSVTQNTNKYIHKLAHQINGTYDFEFYDACAVMCRRMIESLLVASFKHSKNLSAIQRGDGTLEMLSVVINKAKGGQYIHLPRGTAKIIEKIKEIGDTGSHDTYHLLTKQDIDEFRSGFRKVISQLLGLAGITQQPK